MDYAVLILGLMFVLVAIFIRIMTFKKFEKKMDGELLITEDEMSKEVVTTMLLNSNDIFKNKNQDVIILKIVRKNISDYIK